MTPVTYTRFCQFCTCSGIKTPLALQWVTNDVADDNHNINRPVSCTNGASSVSETKLRVSYNYVLYLYA